jgi:hypothetical protein
MILKHSYRLFFLAIIALAAGLFPFQSTARAQGTVYEVGPGKPLASVGAVPWESLQPGDTVLIYWRSTPYKEKFVLCRQGTQTAPITVRGVAGTNGELPILDGNAATTRSVLNYWNQERGVIKVGGANNPPDTLPKYITIENLDIRSARPPFTYFAANGSSQSYSSSASSIYVEKAENLVVRNCILRDSANGFFVASSDSLASRDILVEGNYIYDNGVEGSILQHNNYTAAIGITFQYNRFGPLRANCPGNNLKDRSAGLVVRYNWIESGNRQLDLVDGEDSSLIRGDARYRETYVYGNVLIEPDAAGNRQITHYGGDSGNTPNYRKGTLYFFNNTIVSTRTDRTTLFRLSTNQETCDFRNNLVYVTAAGNTVSLVDADGVLNLTHNWFKPGFVSTFGTLTGTINNDGTSVTGASPGFVNEAGQDYNLAAGSSCLNAGAALHSVVLATGNDLVRQYVKHQTSQTRPASGLLDIGAYERGSATPAPLVLTTTDLPSATQGVSYSATLTASGGTPPYNWSITAGSLPAGLTLNPSTGLISGTPTAGGKLFFTAQVSDAQSPTATTAKELSIIVHLPPLTPLNITTTVLAGGKIGTNYTQTVEATGGLQPYTWTLASGSLPNGLALNSATGKISGTPIKKGTYSFTLRVRDSQATPAGDTQSLSIRIVR